VRKLIESRRVKINGEVWLDDARRLKDGDTVEVLARSAESPQVHIDQIPIRYIDEHLVVVEKPAGISTVRHPAERDWLEERRMLVLTLDDLVMRQIGMKLPCKKHDPRPRLRVVQRLDKETSGLVVFARTVEAERGLGMQFRRHTVTRRYLAIVAGIVTPRIIRSTLIRDRGDGRRGSTTLTNTGKDAITHITVEEALPATRSWRAGWRRGAPTRFASIWRSWAIPSVASACTIAGSTAAPSPMPAVRRALPCTPRSLASRIRSRRKRCTGKCRRPTICANF